MDGFKFVRAKSVDKNAWVLIGQRISDDRQFCVTMPTPMTPERLDMALCSLCDVSGFPEHVSTRVQRSADRTSLWHHHPVP